MIAFAEVDSSTSPQSKLFKHSPIVNRYILKKIILVWVTKYDDQSIKILNKGFLIADLMLKYTHVKSFEISENVTQYGRISLFQGFSFYKILIFLLFNINFI